MTRSVTIDLEVLGLDVDGAARSLDGLRTAATTSTRPPDLGELEISVTPRDPLTRETVARFADLGVHRLIVRPPDGLGGADLTRYVREIGENLISTR